MLREVSAVAVARMSCGERRWRLASARRPLNEGDAVLLAACALGWLAAIVGIAQQGSEDGFVRSACGGEAPAAVVGLVKEPLGDCVDDHVGRAGIESDQLGEQMVERATGRDEGAGRDEREVGDAAEVLQDTRAARMREEGCIEQRHERRALAAGDHVGGAEVGDNGRVDGGCNQGRFAELPGAGEAAAGVGLRDALVIDGLAVAADEIKDVTLRGGLTASPYSSPRRQLRRASSAAEALCASIAPKTALRSGAG